MSTVTADRASARRGAVTVVAALGILTSAVVVLGLHVLPGAGQSRPTPGTWRMLAPMPTARQELAVAVLDGKVFALAGYDTQGASTATVEVYDPKTDTWRSAAPLPVATNHNAAATLHGRLYAFGGTTPRAFVYDGARDGWSEVASMRYPHGGTPAVAVIGNRLYVAGGTGDMVGNELEAYDAGANAWRTLAPMTVPRNHTAGGVVGGRFYVVGGRGSANAAAALEAYDPRTDAWTPRRPMPTGRSGIAAGVVGGRLYVFGGELPRLFGEVEAYDPATDTWQSLPPMPVPRHGIFAGVIGTTIYLPGGATRQGLGATTVNAAFLVGP